MLIKNQSFLRKLDFRTQNNTHQVCHLQHIQFDNEMCFQLYQRVTVSITRFPCNG